ncbi:MAG: hypothetical protein PVI21_03765 [Candidatus Woesebacteria bacterium]|jgi:hypothetical protein
MIIHLKGRKHYEDLYDKITVDIGRREAGCLLQSRDQLYKKIKTDNKDDVNVMEFWWERFYWWLVELPYLLPRWEEREQTIKSWMADDRALDERLAAARPCVEPVCEHCNGSGLRLTDKMFMYRDGSSEKQIIFIFKCTPCKKRTIYWEDGSVWITPVTPCPKCKSPLDMDVKTKGRMMTTTLTCTKCSHKDIERTTLGKHKEEVDPNFECDRKIFCLSEERARTMQAYRPKWEDGMRMLDEEMERDAHKEVYAAVARIERLKIPQVIERLRPAIEAAGYAEVAFDKPELGGYVTVGFSCMDSRSDRDDAKSRKELKKVVGETLSETNWQLMSDGISYRLGYLTGRLRAYEDETDLIKLISAL